MKLTTIVFLPGLILTACSPRIYRPPALGAEYQFDRGLPPAKRQSHLFGKKMNNYLKDQGVERKASSGKGGSATIHRKDSTTVARIKRDSMGKDAPTTLAPAKLPALPDSSHNGQH